jgi:NCAIR mutase (PurE)-related protein
MDQTTLVKLLEDIKSGKLNVAEGLEKLKHLPFDDLGFARVDSHRSLRLGFPEVVFCEGKTDNQILRIAASMLKSKSPVLATRISVTATKKLTAKYPRAKHNKLARTVFIDIPGAARRRKLPGGVAVITAGTADIPVAEEAAVTCEAMGCRVEKLFDVGVAGIHRFAASADILDRHDVFIVVAGMEGALASVVGGFVGKPVIAVPTSIGYGASFGGVAALLAMLNSCSSGITVVNIDSGFAAACAAVRILGLLKEEQ